MMTPRFAFIPLMMTVVLLAGCGNKPIPDPNIKLCPEKTISMLQDNQAFISAAVPNQTPVSAFKKQRGLVRKASLEKAGESSMSVLFYQTGLPQCSWIVSSETLTPVVIRDGVVFTIGGQALKDLTAKGWVIKEATWPWQRYDFGYLPQK